MISKGILIIVPESELNTVADLMAASAGFRINVLRGYVTGREALREIGSGDYQIVHFGGHGGEESLLVSDGPIDDEYLEMALRSAGVELVVLNSCASVSMAAKLYRDGVAPRVIGWPQEDVGDVMASAWATAFYSSLALGAEYWEAYLSSVEVMRGREVGFRAPVFLNGRIVLLEERVKDIQERLAALDGQAVVPYWQVGLMLLAALTALAALLT